MTRLLATAAAALSIAVTHGAVHAAVTKKTTPLVASAGSKQAAVADGALTSKKSAAKAVNAGSSKKSEALRIAEALRAADAALAAQVSESQLEIASRVLTGVADCEFNQTVRVESQPERPGHFRVAFGKVAYSMVPEETTTGTVRLHDAKAGVVWLQIPTKSMLMNARAGQRVVDACMQLEQKIAAAAPASVHAGNSLGWSTPTPVLAAALALPTQVIPTQPALAPSLALSAAVAPMLSASLVLPAEQAWVPLAVGSSLPASAAVAPLTSVAASIDAQRAPAAPAESKGSVRDLVAPAATDAATPAGRPTDKS